MAKTSANGKRIGRPSTYRPERVAPILDRIAAGETLSKICAEPGQPNLWTVYEWLRQDESFARAYARAQDSRADTLADQIADLADEAMRATTPEEIQAYKLRVDARKWCAAKLKPRRYGERVQTELTGADGGPLKVLRVSGDEADL